MNDEDIEKVAEILAKGGSIFMHEDDFHSLVNNSAITDEEDDFQFSARVMIDHSGMIQKGAPVAVKIDEIGTPLRPDQVLGFANTQK